MNHIFGPVASRRLGYSLGVELIPSKTCPFACTYCQVGKTTNFTDKRAEYVSTDDVMAELEKALPKKGVHYVTFSGAGEPSLHIHIGKIISKIKSLCDTPVCVITNSSLMHRKDVRKDLAKADLVIPSLDSAIQDTFVKINRPVKGITAEKVINGLVKFRKAYSGQMRLEIMLVKGINDSIEEISRLKEAVDRINPDAIDLNTVVRPPAETFAEPLEQHEMDRIQGLFGEKARIITSFEAAVGAGGDSDLEEQVYQLVRRRGITLHDLTSGFGMNKDVAMDVLEKLLADGKIKKVSHGGKNYYREKYS